MSAPLRILVNLGRETILVPEMAGDERALGGIPTAAIALSRALVRRGHTVHLFGRCPRPGLHAGLHWHDRSSFARFTREQDVDVLVVIPEILPLLMPVQARARVVWSGNAFQMGDSALAVPYRWNPALGPGGEMARLYSLALLHPYTDRIMIKSHWQAAYMRDRLGIPERLFRVAYNGVPLDHYRGPAPARCRHRLVYTSQARRGLSVLLEIFPRVRAAIPEAELHIFGYEYGESGTPAAMQGAAQRGVCWRGRLDKRALAHELRSAALMVYPCTMKETFCTAVAEAHAAGVPTIVSDRAALTERIEDGVDGYLVPGRPELPETQEAFVSSTVRLLRDDALWQRMGDAAIRKAHRAYDWDRIAAGWEDDLTRLVAHRAPRAPSLGPELNLLDPRLLTISDRASSTTIAPTLAVDWLRAAWQTYGYERGTVPGLGQPQARCIGV